MMWKLPKRPLIPSGRAALACALIGSELWLAVTLWDLPNRWIGVGLMGILEDVLYRTCVWLGLILLLLGLMGGLIHRKQPAGKQAVALSLFGGFFEFCLYWFLHPIFGGSAWGIDLLPSWLQSILGSELVGSLPPWMIWILVQIPLALLVVARSAMSRLRKLGIVTLLAICVIGTLRVWSGNDRRALAETPHVTADALAECYSNHPKDAAHKYNHKRIIVIGTTAGQNEGLIGGGPPRLNSDVQCADLDVLDSVDDGQDVMVLAICDGIDSYGTISLSQCRIVQYLDLTDDRATLLFQAMQHQWSSPTKDRPLRR